MRPIFSAVIPSAFEQHANCAGENSVTVVFETVSKHHNGSKCTEDSSPKVHGGLVNNQGMDTAAKLSTCFDENSKNHGVGKGTNADDDQAHYCDHP